MDGPPGLKSGLYNDLGSRLQAPGRVRRPGGPDEPWKLERGARRQLQLGFDVEPELQSGGQAREQTTHSSAATELPISSAKTMHA